MSVGKVKDFNFSKTAKDMSAAKMGQSVQMAKSNAVQKSLVGQKMTKMSKGGSMDNCGYAKGGKIVEKATSETYPSRRAMEKHESMETPRMQRQEVVQRETVRAPMLKNRGALGVIANKDPGETSMDTAPNLPGRLMMKKGGPVMSKAGTAKVGKVMSEFKSGKLHAGDKSGPKVSSPKQAIAIALSEARRADKKTK